MYFNETVATGWLTFWVTPDGIIHNSHPGKTWENFGTFEPNCNVINWEDVGHGIGRWERIADTEAPQ
jgi:hypothetical protein